MTLLRNNTTVNHSQNIKWKSKHKIIYIYIVKILHYIKKTGKSNIKMFIVVISWCLELQTFFFLTVPFSVFQILFFCVFLLSPYGMWDGLNLCPQQWKQSPNHWTTREVPQILNDRKTYKKFLLLNKYCLVFLFFSKKGREQAGDLYFSTKETVF